MRVGEKEKRRGRRGESKGEYGPGVPMMEAEEEIEKKGRVLKEMGTNRLVVEKGFGLQREMGEERTR
jgi:hypothetical protein